jgi:hypothetical protein
VVDCCLDFSSLEIQLGDLFLDEVCSFGSSVFSYLWLIVGWCIVSILHCLPGVLSGLFVHLPFCFSASRLRHESWGGVGSST